MKTLLTLLLLIPSLSWGLELFCKIQSQYIYSKNNIDEYSTLDLYKEQVSDNDIFVKMNKNENYIQYKFADRKEYIDLKFDILTNDDFYYTSEDAFIDNPSKSNLKDTALIKINRKTGFMTWGYNSENGASKTEYYCEKSEVKF